MSPSHQVPIALIGFGNVGQALLEILIKKRSQLVRDYGLDWKVTAILTGSHGCALAPDGLDPQGALQAGRSGADLSALGNIQCPRELRELLSASRAQVMFENTPVNYRSGQPAIEHLRTALNLGMDAITANKGPVVHAHGALTRLASERGRSFFFESTVMDGAPLFGMWREALPAVRLESFRGVLNSTTNFILGLLEGGQNFDQAIAEAQRIGIAETDPSGDLQGWDAAVKTCALINVLMDGNLQLGDIERTGIMDLTSKQVISAVQNGNRWKLICHAERSGPGISARVQPELVPASDPLYYVTGTSSAVTFFSDALGALTITEQDPGPHTTAYGLLADFINAHKRRS